MESQKKIGVELIERCCDLGVGMKMAIASAAFMSSPIWIPPLMLLLTIVFVFSVPFGVLFAVYATSRSIARVVVRTAVVDPMAENGMGKEEGFETFDDSCEAGDVCWGEEKEGGGGCYDFLQKSREEKQEMGMIATDHENADSSSPVIGKNADTKPMTGEAVIGKNSNTKRITGEVVIGKNADTKPMTGEAVIGKNADTKSMTGESVIGKNADTKPVTGEAVIGKNADTKRMTEEAVIGKNADTKPMTREAVIGKNADTKPMTGEVVIGKNVDTKPITGEAVRDIEVVALNDNMEMINNEQQLWEEIDAMRTIIGCKTEHNPELIEELKTLYLFTGLEPPVFSISSFDLVEVNSKLQFLKSVIGVM